MDYFINVLQTIGEDFFYSSEDKEVSEVIDDFIYYLIDAISKSSDIEKRERYYRYYIGNKNLPWDGSMGEIGVAIFRSGLDELKSKDGKKNFYDFVEENYERIVDIAFMPMGIFIARKKNAEINKLKNKISKIEEIL